MLLHICAHQGWNYTHVIADEGVVFGKTDYSLNSRGYNTCNMQWEQ